MVTQERIGQPRPQDAFPCSDVFCMQNISPAKSIANQSLSITANFVVSRNEKERCVTRQNCWMGQETNSLLAQLVIVSSRKAPPHKGVKEALRDKKKKKKRAAAPD